MPAPRDTAIAAATALIDALLAAVAPTPPIDPIPVPPIVIPTGHPRIMLGSQAARLKAALSSTPAVAWKVSLARWLVGGDVYDFSAWNGALYGALAGDARYTAKAIAQIDAQVTSAEAQIAAGRAPEVAGDSYLQVGKMIGDLALVYDWGYATLTPAQRTRWIAYANQAVWNVWHAAAANWGGKVIPWSGWSVNNPSNNYYYSFMRATMLLGLATREENQSAGDWIAQFKNRLDLLVLVFNRDLQGGGSREGTGYGTAMNALFELYAIWEWSTGERIADRTSHTRASLSTALQQIVPTLDRVALTGDLSRDETAALFDYHRFYLEVLIALYPDAPESASAAALLAMSSVPKMANGFMQGIDFIFAPAPAPKIGSMPLVRYVSGAGQIYGRTSWAKDATWMNLIAGPYTESHAHQDQGSICIYKGTWLVLDAVMWSHSGVTDVGHIVGTPKAHSLVRVDQGSDTVGQKAGSISKVLALHAGPGYVFASLDLSPAYAGTAVTMMRRQVLWLQPDVFLIQDRVSSTETTQQVWQLVVPTSPVITGADALVVGTGHTLRVTRMNGAGSWSSRSFKESPDKDFSGGFALEQFQAGGDHSYVTLLSIDSALSAATPTVVFADVGVSFALNGRTLTLGAGIDVL